MRTAGRSFGCCAALTALTLGCSDGRAVTAGPFDDAGGSATSGASSSAGAGTGGATGSGAAGGVGPGGAAAGGVSAAGGSAANAGTGGDGGHGGVPAGAGVGDACGPSAACRAGLTCGAGVCEPGGTTPLGGPCVISAECVPDAQCVAATCVGAGTGLRGDACTADADCAGGLRCTLRGLGLECVPEGSTDVGGACASPADCFAGLSCSAGECRPSVPGVPVFGTPSFARVACADPVADDETVRALFEVPGAAGAAATDFFALPFPNDVRLRDGRPDLTGFPTPGAALLGFDPMARYVRALEAHAAGWGTNPAVIFRFSGRIDWASFASGSKTVWFVDITPDGGARYGEIGGAVWQYFPNRTNAVCSDWLAVRRPDGSPLRPGRTYAVWLTDAGKAADGADIQRSPHFLAMLGDTAPATPALAAAWQRYQPLRDFIANPPAWWSSASPEPLEPPRAARLLAAAVFTVDDVTAPMASLAAAVEAAPIPRATRWVRCGAGEPSPCPQALGERACGTGTSDYAEYHALVSLPIFQQGSAPYAEAGGAIAAAAVRSEDVCLALTVPTGETPASGWPLVIFAHGTGGSFRSHVRASVAGALSSVTTSAGEVRFAVLGIDQVSHGPRRGVSDEDPSELFYNFLNPDAARGNPMQGAADQLALARFAATLGSASGGPAIAIDPSRVLFFGHSQGATQGSLGVPFGGSYPAAVLSGHGGSIKDALLTKRSPVDLASVVPFLIGDPVLRDGHFELAGGVYHPGLTLLSHWLDPADPLNFARLMTVEPPAGQSPRHAFMVYGQGDTYSPGPTMQAYAVAGRFAEADPVASVSRADPLGLTRLSVPVQRNVTVSGGAYTLAVRQYAPATGADGHFVAFDVANATTDVARFLGLAAQGQAPAVGP